MDNKKLLHVVAFALVLVGALNWGLVGLLKLNLVEAIFGMGTMLTNVVYLLVGASAVYIALTHKDDCRVCGKK
jgi:hypothetical protein